MILILAWECVFIVVTDNHVSVSLNVFEIFNNQRDLVKMMSDYEIKTVLADGLAPTGARPSAGTVLTKIESYKHTEAANERLKQTECWTSKLW